MIGFETSRASQLAVRFTAAVALAAALFPSAARAETEADFKKEYAKSAITMDKIEPGDILVRRKYDGEVGGIWKAFNQVSINLAKSRINKYHLDPRSSVNDSHVMMAIGHGHAVHADTKGVVSLPIPPDYHFLVFRPTDPKIAAEAVKLGIELADKGLAYSLRKARKLPTSWTGPTSTPASLARTRDRVKRFLKAVEGGKKLSNPSASISLLAGGNVNLLSGKGFFCSEFVVACYQAATTTGDGYIPLRSRHATPVDLESLGWTENEKKTGGKFKFVGAKLGGDPKPDNDQELIEMFDSLEGSQDEVVKLDEELKKVVKPEGLVKLVLDDTGVEESAGDDVTPPGDKDD